jgi:hypothetical protein
MREKVEWGRGASDGDAFHNVPRHLSPTSVIEPGDPRIGVLGEVLHVLQSTDILHLK